MIKGTGEGGGVGLMPQGPKTVWLKLPAYVVERYQLSRDSVMVHADLWKKIATKHPESLSAAELHLEAAITEPDYVGQAPQHFENIEMIRRTPAGPLLVAIKIRNKKGFEVRPLVASVYLIEQRKLANRLENRTVVRVK